MPYARLLSSNEIESRYPRDSASLAAQQAHKALSESFKLAMITERDIITLKETDSLNICKDALDKLLPDDEIISVRLIPQTRCYVDWLEVFHNVVVAFKIS